MMQPTFHPCSAHDYEPSATPSCSDQASCFSSSTKQKADGAAELRSMDIYDDGAKKGSSDPIGMDKNEDDVWRQLGFSVALGLTAFVVFCILRPRWSTLYAARRKRKSAAFSLPPLPSSMFGWMPVVYNITEEEVLQSAGLDAFVFLAFLKMAIKYVTFLLFFALIVIYPVTKDDDKQSKDPKPKPSGFVNAGEFSAYQDWANLTANLVKATNQTDGGKHNLGWYNDKGHDWTQFIFVYVYTFMGIYFILKETQRMIRIRQKHLAAQSSISDRTFRLSGIPQDLRNEDKLKETIENLEIGRVESVTLCRNWTELDDLMEDRNTTLRRLEESWSVFLGTGKASRKMRRRYRGEDETNGDEEQAGLLSGDEVDDGAHVVAYNKPRPETRIWYGFMSLQSRKVDAIDYYEERLRRLDERIKTSRKKDFTATPLAFITLDSTAACQMACQAIIDPQPMQLIASPSPSPTSIVWRNTYLSRRSRMIRAWSVTAFIIVLTILWSFLLIPVAGVQTLAGIRAVLPKFADWLEDHKTALWVVSTGIPTLLVSLLNVAVPYIYEYLSYRQGMTALSDIEMSLISKNFFFTLFNLLIILTIFKTGIEAAAIFKLIEEYLRDLHNLPKVIFNSLRDMSWFYLNYLVLQTLGLFPFRLLQFGTVFLYPFYRWFAKTPRDYSELAQPSIFTYGFYIPQTLFTLVVCVVYSTLQRAHLVELLGLVYFAFAAFVYKYQLLYSMDHRQFSTGRAWPMMCLRLVVGIVIFQLVAIGNLITDGAVIRSALTVPLIISTVWFGIWYKKTYEPLMRNIALRTLREVHEVRMEESILSGESGEDEDRTRSRTPSHRRMDGKYVNPSLVADLSEPWIARTAAREAEIHGNGTGGLNDGNASEEI